MCRLVAVSSHFQNSGNKVLLFDMLMARAQADQNQIGGAGITDGKNIVKSGDQYSYGTYDGWYHGNFDGSRAWMGHVRKPSSGVAKPSNEAAHPFHFPDTGLIGAHNGFITQAVPSAPEDGIPYVDSYYTFAALNALLKKHGKVTKDVLNEWIGGMGPGSEYTFMFYYADELWVLRGIRPMYYVNLNGGRVYCTSTEAIHSVISFTSALWGKGVFDWGNTILTMQENVAYNVTRSMQFAVRTPPAPPALPVQKRYYRFVNGVWE